MAPPPIARPGPRWIVRGLALAGLALVELLLLLWLVTVLVLVLVGLGVYLAPSALAGVRGAARRQRTLAGRWSGVEVAAPPPSRIPAGRGFRGAWRVSTAVLRDRSTWRELLWLLVDPVVGFVVALLPAALLVYGLWGIAIYGLWGPVLSGAQAGEWYAFVPLRGQSSAAVAAGLGIVLIVLAPLVARPAVRLHALWVRAVLGTPYQRLADRAAELERSRSDAVDQAWSEIRRIERDLHDGAQARLVAVGMTLTAAERTIDTDPAAALALVREAKASSVAALAELRDLVRGVYPPVLADRGLVDAIRAAALAGAVPTSVRSSLGDRAAPPVESAVYFAVTELLTNVGKHAGATRAEVDLDLVGSALRVRVRDDGTGGADATRGTGLAGVARRLAVFDGTIDVASPAGGPTVATLTVPWTPGSEP